MAEIVIYTSMFCPFCWQAKGLLKAKGVAYEEIDVTMSAAKRAEMARRAGAATVPQIFIDGEAVGGCDELHALESAGLLDARLGLAA